MILPLQAAAPHARIHVAVAVHETQHCVLHERVRDQGVTEQLAVTTCSAHSPAAVKMPPFPVDGALLPI